MSAIWTKVTAWLKVEPEDWSVWAEVFDQHGLSGTLQTDEPPTISAYVPPGNEEGVEPLINALRQHGALDVTTEAVPEENWAESWKQFFKPSRIGTFLVRPTWETCDIGLDEIEIVLDPGQAFGTGDHPTTKMCLQLIQSELSHNAGASLADIGCGSGILSIGALKLGASSAIAVDTDALSVEATAENAARNGVSVSVHLGKGFDPVPAGATFDVVVSNIISAALISLAPEVSTRVEKGGAWIVSGIIVSNWADVRAKAEAVGFKLETELQEGEWIAATFRR